MKILLDENLPQRLKTYFSASHVVFTVREMGWNGKRNGELLSLSVSSGFELFITLDKNLQYQQKFSKFDITVFLLSSPDNKRKTFEILILKVIALLEAGSFSKYQIIEK